ncbi:MAG: hypothetical protein QG565_337, partial [Campylobacterota bacterium]|nr:hypothetical protein [Campylobacterota bacterium]
TQQNKETLAQEKAKQAQELEQRAKTIQGLQEQKAALETQIDIIVNDLASIKESKCWIYTKPIRDLQKVMKK